MYKLKTSVSFEAAHRLFDVDTYSEECRNNIHGHSYIVEVVVGRDKLNSAGMVMDFKLLKKIIKSEIEDKYDHSAIVKRIDPLSRCLIENCKKVIIVEDNPTAEWMSQQFFYAVRDAIVEIDDDVKVISVSVQETERNIATYEED